MEQALYALRVLKSHGKSEGSLQAVFQSTVVSTLTYASPAWRGFASAAVLDRVDRFNKTTSEYLDISITSFQSDCRPWNFIDPELKFSMHIHEIAARAKQRAALIHTLFPLSFLHQSSQGI